MADERSVDVDERKDPQPATGRRRTPLAAIGRLSPLQQAWGRYVGHATGCERCRSIDYRCATADDLYRAWRELSEDAYRRLADGA